MDEPESKTVGLLTVIAEIPLIPLVWVESPIVTWENVEAKLLSPDTSKSPADSTPIDCPEL